MFSVFRREEFARGHEDVLGPWGGVAAGERVWRLLFARSQGAVSSEGRREEGGGLRTIVGSLHLVIIKAYLDPRNLNSAANTTPRAGF